MNSRDKKVELKKITGVSVTFMTVALLFSSVFQGIRLKEPPFGHSLLKVMRTPLQKLLIIF